VAVSVVGIDLGTTNTVVACVRSGKVHVLADEHGLRLLPSVVSFHPNGEVLVGAAAKARRVIDPRNTVYSDKRLIGRSWGSLEIAQAKSRFAFELKEGPGQGPLVRARNQDYTLPEISAFVLKRSRQIAETALGTTVERAVITVPAHFNELQRASTKVAGRVSGLEVLRILNEPTAAALAYGLGRSGNERVAVYDFGGGTFDCTLLDLNGNVFEVLATAGDSFLGGDDVDALIAERMAEVYLKTHRYDPRTDASMLERLKATAEEVKIVLSTAETHTVTLKEFGHGAGGAAITFSFTLTRRDLDQMVTPLVERSFKVTQDALSLARLSPTSFDKVILVGGSTRMPLVRRRVEAFFGQAPLDRVNPDEVVAIGAAIQAAALTEGARRRSIPAAPPVMGGKPKTLPGVQNQLDDDTQTGQIESKLGEPTAPSPGPAFGSAPPNFGFHPASSPPPATKSGPPTLGLGKPPGPGAPAAPADRKITNPGVGTSTQPLGQHKPPPRAPGASQGPGASSAEPDLGAPAPFEWFPSTPSQDAPGASRPGPAGSERSFGGNTITATGGGVAADTVANARARPDDDFGAIDEPPSMYSTPSASVPSFPSMTGGPSMMGGGVPSPIGEPEPMRGSVPDGPFGAVNDLSLISSTGVTGVTSPSATALPGTSPDVRGAQPSAPDVFGHVADLSLLSSTAGSQGEAVTAARQKLLAELEDDTAKGPRPPVTGVAGGKGSTVNLDPAANPGARAPAALMPTHDEDDLPALAPSVDLPSVPKGKRPEIRSKTGGPASLGQPGQPGGLPPGPGQPVTAKPAGGPAQPAMTASGGPAMLGKPPPAQAPQPFGPMERVPEDQPSAPLSRTAAMQARPPAGAAPSPQPAGRGAQPLAKTMPAAQPLPATTPSASPQQAQQAQAQRSQARPATAPIPQTPDTRMPGPQPARTSPMPQAPAFAQTTPLQQRAPQQVSPPPPPVAPPGPNATAQFGSQAAPAGPYGSAPPPPQPPIFGSYASSPPPAEGDGLQLGSGATPHLGHPGPSGSGGYPAQQVYQAPYPGPSQPPQPNVAFAAPVLVDVTPRGLIVETAGGYTDTIIARNSKIPCERTRRFATGRDMQTTVRVRVAQGESQGFTQNTYLGEVELSGLRPAPRGEVVVAVTFEVDADGTLRVRARDVQTGQEARATLQLIGVADESSVVMMINRFAQQPVVGGPTG